MSASSRPVRVLVSTRPYPCLDSFDRVVGIGWGRGGEEDVALWAWRLTRRRLAELLVALSSGVDEVVVECEALAYRPVAEAVLAYRWLIGDEYRVVIVGSCCEEARRDIPGDECRPSPCH